MQLLLKKTSLHNSIMTSLVKPKNGLLTLITKSKIVDEIKSQFGSTVISEVDKFEPAIVEYIMNLVENFYAKNSVANGKVNKKEVVISVLKQFVAISPTEESIIDKIIEYIHSIARVKKVSTVKKVSSAITTVATNLVSGSTGNASS